MKLLNITPGKADVTVAGIKYGHVEKHGVRWHPFDKEGEALGDGRESRKSAAEFVLYCYRERASQN